MKCRSAMTLVEVLAVVVILALIASTLAVGFSGAFGKGKQELARAGIGQVMAKLELYRMEFDGFPSLEDGLAAITDGLASPTAAYYMPGDRLLDPWGRRFLYLSPGPEGHPFEVVTLGADGRPGGEGESADISSANLRGVRP